MPIINSLNLACRVNIVSLKQHVDNRFLNYACNFCGKNYHELVYENFIAKYPQHADYIEAPVVEEELEEEPEEDNTEIENAAKEGGKLFNSSDV